MSSSPLQEVKNNGKSLTIRPKKWSRSLTGGVRLLEFTSKALAGKFWCFGLAAVYGRWSRGSLVVFGNIWSLGTPESFLFPFLSGQNIRGAL